LDFFCRAGVGTLATWAGVHYPAAFPQTAPLLDWLNGMVHGSLL
jgi:hypothetical protein